MRAFVSLGTLFSFILLIISSIVLYFTPEGRIAYWANWSLGLSKAQWGDVHVTGGLLFIIFACWHTLNNFKAIKNYCVRTFSGKIWPLTGSLIVCLLVYGGTILEIQPLHQFAVWGGQIKQSHAKTYGNPPFGHAEMSTIQQFCTFLGLDTAVVIAGLEEQGFAVRPNSIFKDVAASKNMTPQQLYDLIQRVTGVTPSTGKGRGRGRTQAEPAGAPVAPAQN